MAGLASSLPGVTGADHHGRVSWRVGGTPVLATVPEPGVLNVMVGEADAHAAVQRHPGAVELLWWGTTLSGVRAVLADLSEDDVRALLEDAWTRRAPAALQRRRG